MGTEFKCFIDVCLDGLGPIENTILQMLFNGRELHHLTGVKNVKYYSERNRMDKEVEFVLPDHPFFTENEYWIDVFNRCYLRSFHQGYGQIRCYCEGKWMEENYQQFFRWIMPFTEDRSGEMIGFIQSEDCKMPHIIKAMDYTYLGYEE